MRKNPSTAWLLIGLLFLGGCGAGGGDPVTSTPPADQPARPPATSPPAESPPPASTLLTWDVHGTLADGGSVSGSITYDTTAQPYADSFNGLQGKQQYHLASWNLTVLQHVVIPSLVTFTNTIAFNTASICLGQCLFSPILFEQILVSNGAQTLSLLFSWPEQPFHGLPASTAEWGVLDGGNSTLRSLDAQGGFQYLEFVVAGDVTTHIND